MSVPVAINNRAIAVVFVSLLHVAIPWVVAVAALCIGLDFTNAPLHGELQSAVVVVAVACLFLVELPRLLSLKAAWGHLPMATAVIARWLGIVLILVTVRVATDVLDPIPHRVFAAWAVTAPLLV